MKQRQSLSLRDFYSYFYFIFTIYLLIIIFYIPKINQLWKMTKVAINLKPM